MPSTVLIGTFLLHTQVLKDQLLEKIDRTCELLMRLICERARQHAATVSEAFTEMFGQLDQQPSDIEKLTEISEFMATLTEKSDELEETIQMMTDHYEVLEDLQFEVPQEDFTGRWETFHWPLRLKLKQEECNKMLEEDRNLFQKEMSGQQTQFEKAVEKLNDKVDKFGEHTSLGAIKQVVAEVKEIEQTLKDYEERARTFNSREALFGQPVTEYEYLPLINKNFEPYRDLWLNSYDWQNWQREWMDGPMIKLDPDEVEKSYVTATRSIFGFHPDNAVNQGNTSWTYKTGFGAQFRKDNLFISLQPSITKLNKNSRLNNYDQEQLALVAGRKFEQILISSRINKTMRNYEQLDPFISSLRKRKDRITEYSASLLWMPKTIEQNKMVPQLELGVLHKKIKSTLPNFSKETTDLTISWSWVF